jgi:hypothetical protein
MVAGDSPLAPMDLEFTVILVRSFPKNGCRITMHADNELVARVFQLKKGFTFDSGWIALVGWDFPEVRLRRIASFANSK